MSWALKGEQRCASRKRAGGRIRKSILKGPGNDMDRGTEGGDSQRKGSHF